MKLFSSLARRRVQRRRAAPLGPARRARSRASGEHPRPRRAAPPQPQNADWTRRPARRSLAAPAARPGARSLRAPLVPPSPCQPGVRVFVFPSEGNGTAGENGSDEQTKEGEGPGTKLSAVLQGEEQPGRKELFERSVREHCLSQELGNLWGGPWPLPGLRAISVIPTLLQTQTQECKCRLATAEPLCPVHT